MATLPWAPAVFRRRLRWPRVGIAARARGQLVTAREIYAIEDLQKLHHVAASLEEAARLALKAGIDIDLPSPGAYATLAQQVRAGTVPMARIDAAVRRLLALKIRAGLFEHPFADLKQAAALTNNSDAELKAFERISLSAGESKMVTFRLTPEASACGTSRCSAWSSRAHLR